jgi:hypothetical protein
MYRALRGDTLGRYLPYWHLLSASLLLNARGHRGGERDITFLMPSLSVDQHCSTPEGIEAAIGPKYPLSESTLRDSTPEGIEAAIGTVKPHAPRVALLLNARGHRGGDRRRHYYAWCVAAGSTASSQRVDGARTPPPR